MFFKYSIVSLFYKISSLRGVLVFNLISYLNQMTINNLSFIISQSNLCVSTNYTSC